MQLGVKIDDTNESFHIEVVIVADFYFDSDINQENLNKIFINAPAPPLPYEEHIFLCLHLIWNKSYKPATLNLTALGGQLQQNTVESTECGEVDVK